MKVLVVLYKFGTLAEIGKHLGSYDYFLNQLLALQKRGVEIIVLAPWIRYFKKGSQQIDEIKIIRYWPKLAPKSWRNFLLYKIINKLYIWQTVKLIQKLVKKENINLVYARQARETGYAVVKAKNRIKAKIIFQPITTWKWHFQNSNNNLFQKMVSDIKNQKKYTDAILQNFDYLIVYNKAMRDEYISLGADKNKFQIIPGAVKHEIFKPQENVSETRKKLNLPLDKKIILYIGRINIKEKGINYLLQSIQKISEQQKDFKLILIGPSTQKQKNKLFEIIKELKIENFVEYLGGKKYYDLPEYINCANVGVVPSVWFESFGRTTLDMISCGLPVITTKVGGICETNIHRETGLNVKPKNSTELAKAILQIINNTKLQKEFSDNARQRVLDYYTLAKTTNKLIDFFEKILN